MELRLFLVLVAVSIGKYVIRINGDPSLQTTAVPAAGPTTTSQSTLSTGPTTTSQSTLTPSIYDCSFESGFCNWSQDTTDQGDWERAQGPNGTLQPGPVDDHTTGTSQGWYAYYPPPPAGNRTVTARLQSVVIPTGRRCIRFFLLMESDSFVQFTIYIKEAVFTTAIYGKLVSQGLRWVKTLATVNPRTPYQIILEAKQQESSHGLIALDDITSEPGYCSETIHTKGNQTLQPTAVPTVGRTTPSQSTLTAHTHGDVTFKSTVVPTAGRSTPSQSTLEQSKEELKQKLEDLQNKYQSLAKENAELTADKYNTELKIRVLQESVKGHKICDTVNLPVGKYPITLFPDDGQGLVEVLCDVVSPGDVWTVFQKRFNGTESFSRGFAAYDAGFGSVHGELWLGFKQMKSIMTTGQYQLRVDIADYNGVNYTRIYPQFGIGAFDGYTLTVDGYNDGEYTTIMFFALCAMFAVLAVPYGQTEAGTVAFTAAFDSDRDIAGGQTLIFNKVFLNFGGGYNNKTGVFTAPSGGVYVFNIYGLAQKTKDFWIELVHNNEYIVSAFARQGSDHDAAGNSVTRRVKKNDTVHVRARRTAYFYNRPDEVYATFNGYRIGLLNDGE